MCKVPIESVPGECLGQILQAICVCVCGAEGGGGGSLVVTMRPKVTQAMHVAMPVTSGFRRVNRVQCSHEDHMERDGEGRRRSLMETLHVSLTLVPSAVRTVTSS